MDYKFWVPVVISLVSSIALAIWNIFQQKRFEDFKKEAEKQLFNHRLKFEKEFVIYDELWANLIELRKSIVMLQPLVDYQTPGKTYEDTIKERLIKLTELSNATVDLFLKRKPFYSIAVYDRIEPLLKLVRQEILEVKPSAMTAERYWEKRQHTVAELIALSDQICDAIRKRVNAESWGVLKWPDFQQWPEWSFSKKSYIRAMARQYPAKETTSVLYSLLRELNSDKGVGIKELQVRFSELSEGVLNSEFSSEELGRVLGLMDRVEKALLNKSLPADGLRNARQILRLRSFGDNAQFADE